MIANGARLKRGDVSCKSSPVQDRRASVARCLFPQRFRDTTFDSKMNFFVQRSELRDLYDKVAAGERISETDALRLFDSRDCARQHHLNYE